MTVRVHIIPLPGNQATLGVSFLRLFGLPQALDGERAQYCETRSLVAGATGLGCGRGPGTGLSTAPALLWLLPLSSPFCRRGGQTHVFKFTPLVSGRAVRLQRLGRQAPGRASQLKPGMAESATRRREGALLS